MKKDYRFFLKLFISTFYISAFTFGGGFVIIPLLRKKFVEQYHWIEEAEMLDLTAIAQSSPGAIAVNASILIGYRLAGIRGALITVLGTILPPMITLSVISIVYTAFRDSLLVSRVLRGMQAGVAAVIFDVVITMAKEIFKEKSIIAVLIMFGAFIASWILQVNIIFIILTCGIIGVITVLYHEKKGRLPKGGDAQ